MDALTKTKIIARLLLNLVEIQTIKVFKKNTGDKESLGICIYIYLLLLSFIYLLLHVRYHMLGVPCHVSRIVRYLSPVMSHAINTNSQNHRPSRWLTFQICWTIGDGTDRQTKIATTTLNRPRWRFSKKNVYLRKKLAAK